MSVTKRARTQAKPERIRDAPRTALVSLWDWRVQPAFIPIGHVAPLAPQATPRRLHHGGHVARDRRPLRR